MKALNSCSWEVTSEKVEAAVRKIIEISRPLKLILFGSYARSAMNINSDLDILVITRNDVVNSRKESIRIRRALRGISMPMDILVVPEDKWRELKDQPGFIYREALRKGKVIYESLEIVEAEVDEALHIAEQTVSWAKSILLKKEGEES